MTKTTKEDATLALIANLIMGTEFEEITFVAGGFVRDKILGLYAKDIDLVVEAPNGGIRLAQFLKSSLSFETTVVVYPKFGTAAVHVKNVSAFGFDLDGMEIECVMTRKEQYHNDTRKPDVQHGTLAEDVERRDFTVNSLLMRVVDSEILDLTGKGQDDIANGIIQTPLDPDIIFSEDPLRMLRAIRFAVKYGWELPSFMVKAISKNHQRMEIVSMERINVEFTKMMISPDPVRALRLLLDTNLVLFVIPELGDLGGVEQGKFHHLDALEHTLSVVENTPSDLIVRLSAVLHDIAKSLTRVVLNGEVHFYKHDMVGAGMAISILQRLKFPTEIIKAVSKIVGHHMRTKAFGDEGRASAKALRKLKADMGDLLEPFLTVVHADNVSHAPEHCLPNQVKNLRDKLDALSEEPTKPVLPISGNDIMEEFDLKPGKHIGEMLAIVKEEWFGNPELTREDALKLIAPK